MCFEDADDGVDQQPEESGDDDTRTDRLDTLRKHALLKKPRAKALGAPADEFRADTEDQSD